MGETMYETITELRIEVEQLRNCLREASCGLHHDRIGARGGGASKCYEWCFACKVAALLSEDRKDPCSKQQ